MARREPGRQRLPGPPSLKEDGLPSFARLRAAAIGLHPDLRGQRFVINDEGWSSHVLESENGILFRFPRTPAAARHLEFEVRLLRFLRGRLSVPIPVPLGLGTLPGPEPRPFLSYRKLPGVTLGHVGPLGRTARSRVESLLGTLLPELAAVPPSAARRIGCPAGDPVAWALVYERMYERYRRVGSRSVSRPLDRAIRSEFDRGLELLRGVRFAPVLTHLDLGPYNIIWDPVHEEPSGVIDWEDTRLGDPSFDLVAVGCVGAAGVRRLAGPRRSDDDRSFWRRVTFYGQLVTIQDLLHGLEHGDHVLYRRCRRRLEARYGAR